MQPGPEKGGPQNRPNSSLTGKCTTCKMTDGPQWSTYHWAIQSPFGGETNFELVFNVKIFNFYANNSIIIQHF